MCSHTLQKITREPKGPITASVERRHAVVRVNITTHSSALSSPHLLSSPLASPCGKVIAAGRTCALGHHSASRLQPGCGHKRQTLGRLMGCMRNQPSLCSEKNMAWYYLLSSHTAVHQLPNTAPVSSSHLQRILQGWLLLTEIGAFKEVGGCERYLIMGQDSTRCAFQSTQAKNQLAKLPL